MLGFVLFPLFVRAAWQGVAFIYVPASDTTVSVWMEYTTGSCRVIA
jgi:hypothetical protein